MTEVGEKLTKQDKELLLKEYELCQNSAQNLEAAIWQTSAAIGIGSIGALALVTGRQQPDAPCWLVLGIPVIVGLLAILASGIWWGMARRWWSIQHAKYCRMRHIEERLKLLHQIRYLTYLDGLDALKVKKRDTEEVKAQKEEEARKLEERFLPRDLTLDQQEDLDELSKRHQSRGVQKFVCCLPVLNAIAWVFYWVFSVLLCLLS